MPTGIMLQDGHLGPGLTGSRDWPQSAPSPHNYRRWADGADCSDMVQDTGAAPRVAARGGAAFQAAFFKQHTPGGGGLLYSPPATNDQAVGLGGGSVSVFRYAFIECALKSRDFNNNDFDPEFE